MIQGITRVMEVWELTPNELFYFRPFSLQRESREVGLWYHIVRV
jgi:hypothetical protein